MRVRRQLADFDRADLEWLGRAGRRPERVREALVRSRREHPPKSESAASYARRENPRGIERRSRSRRKFRRISRAPPSLTSKENTRDAAVSHERRRETADLSDTLEQKPTVVHQVEERNPRFSLFLMRISSRAVRGDAARRRGFGDVSRALRKAIWTPRGDRFGGPLYRSMLSFVAGAPPSGATGAPPPEGGDLKTPTSGAHEMKQNEHTCESFEMSRNECRARSTFVRARSEPVDAVEAREALHELLVKGEGGGLLEA